MSVHGFCFDVGMSGKCCDNCYSCADENGGDFSNDDIIDKVGISEQQRMLREYIQVDIGYNITLAEIIADELTNSNDWEEISKYKDLSEDIIRECKDKVNWQYISMCQLLSESFIREFQDRVDWKYISAYDELSNEFIKEFKDKF